MNKKFSAYDDLFQKLGSRQHAWLITGVAGFIGSNLLETLLKLDQKVVGIDNFSTGYQDNLDEVKVHVSKKQWSNFQFTKGDIRDIGHCHLVCSGVEFVLHQAALGSVSRSIEDPINTNSVNIEGFLNMLIASRDAKVKSFVYAASSSTYGDHPDLPKTEDKIGKPLSPYAVTKYVNELYADVFAKCYEFKTIGLRYFNVFGPRQNPSGAYAAVIPRWVASMLTSESIYINGDGQSSRDFTYVENVIQANLLAAMANDQARNQIYNVAAGEQTTLNQLFNLIAQSLRRYIDTSELKPIYRDFRPADVRHSLADISKARNFLGYSPTHTLMDGIPLACEGYLKNFRVDQ